ncbi:hypothetical protein J1C67_12415 [Clostridium gasigenes]|uniref:hypothetical protein n=1 Tax=Clostridium gasigenes TaxID=94869 RepID=UPI0014383627|nr:hypothetical protein [Clostridium gasigenes]NKF07386.1 hypothetical protein [Clostridium gasigenes]QSW18353.1 hypothetical protein J1C67_12415 [Clostridium gasigenes]
MKNFKHYATISLALIFLSTIMYISHNLIFGQVQNTIYYSLMNICIIPINILTVTIVFENIIDHKSKKKKLNKLNMLIGMFFSELGYELMHLIIQGDKNGKNLICCFDNLKDVETKLITHDHLIDINQININNLEEILLKHRDILINLMSNDNILEHDIFTDLLMSIMHLRDELIFMKNNNKDENTILHLQVDIARVYKNITAQWVNYLYHLEKFYPHLYKTAIQVNPFL